jgi:1,4-dihydroxy-2-naphthoyl-CoA hydrolase
MQPVASEYPFAVRLANTDAAGVLFYAQLFRHAHDAYEAWMAAIGHPLDAMIRGGGPALPIVHAQADYRLPMRHGDMIRVCISVEEIGGRSFAIGYRFVNAEGRPAATARTVHAAIDPNGLGALALPADLRAALRQAQASSS